MSICSISMVWKKLHVLKIDMIDFYFDFNIIRKNLKCLSDLYIESRQFNDIWHQQVLDMFRELPELTTLTFHSDPTQLTMGLFLSEFLDALYGHLKVDKHYIFKSWPAPTINIDSFVDFLRKCKNGLKSVILNLGLVTFVRDIFESNWVNLRFYRVPNDIKSYFITHTVLCRFTSTSSTLFFFKFMQNSIYVITPFFSS